MRWTFHGPNVDDYLYTIVASQIWAPLTHAHVVTALTAVLDTGQYAPLVPLLGAPLSSFGPDIVVLVQLPLLILLTVLVFAIVSRLGNERLAFIAALTTALASPALKWSLMVHMALASGVCTLACCWWYLESDGFRRRLPSVLTGVMFALLALSRSMAPVYVVCLVAAIALGMLHRHRGAWRRRLVNLALAGVSAIVVAAPWYWRSGPAAFSYLTSFGYSPVSGFTRPGNSLVLRIEQTTSDTGWLLLVVLAFVTALAVRRRTSAPSGATATRGDEAAFVLLTFAACVFAFLSTTHLAGTAFDLPAIVALIPGVFLLWPRTDAPSALASGLATIAVASALLQAYLLPGWHERSSFAGRSPLYASGLVEALGTPSRGLAALTEELSRRIGENDVVVTRDDAVVNVQGFRYYKVAARRAGTVSTVPYDPATRQNVVSITRGFVVTGESCAPYHTNVDGDALNASLRSVGFDVVWSQRLSPCNELVLWAR